MNIAKIFENNYYEEHLRSIVVFNSNEENAKLDEVGYDIIVFYIYLFHFVIILFVVYPEAVVLRFSLKRYS